MGFGLRCHRLGEAGLTMQQSVAAERVFEGRVIRVDVVAADVVLDMEAGGIGPIVEDLAAWK
jgi:hypothetical protein